MGRAAGSGKYGPRRPGAHTRREGDWRVRGVRWRGVPMGVDGWRRASSRVLAVRGNRQAAHPG